MSGKKSLKVSIDARAAKQLLVWAKKRDIDDVSEAVEALIVRAFGRQAALDRWAKKNAKKSNKPKKAKATKAKAGAKAKTKTKAKPRAKRDVKATPAAAAVASTAASNGATAAA